jgi:hypothetical protein
MGLLEFWTGLKCAISVITVGLVIYQQQLLERLVAEQPCKRRRVLTVHHIQIKPVGPHSSSKAVQVAVLGQLSRTFGLCDPNTSPTTLLRVYAILSNALQTLSRCKIKHVTRGLSIAPIAKARYISNALKDFLTAIVAKLQYKSFHRFSWILKTRVSLQL